MAVVIDDRIGDLRPIRDPVQALRRIGLFLADSIIEATQGGKGPDGQRLPGYSKRWAMVRRKHGRQTSRRDLNFNGTMLSSITQRIERMGDGVAVRLFFARPEDGLKAHGHHHGNPKTRLPATRFFSLNDKRRERATRIIREEMNG
jgi:hypothetical protein